MEHSVCMGQTSFLFSFHLKFPSDIDVVYKKEMRSHRGNKYSFLTMKTDLHIKDLWLDLFREDCFIYLGNVSHKANTSWNALILGDVVFAQRTGNYGKFHDNAKWSPRNKIGILCLLSNLCLHSGEFLSSKLTLANSWVSKRRKLWQQLWPLRALGNFFIMNLN